MRYAARRCDFVRSRMREFCTVNGKCGVFRSRLFDHPVARHINYAALAELYVVGHLVLGRVVYDEDLVRSCLKYRDIT